MIAGEEFELCVKLKKMRLENIETGSGDDIVYCHNDSVCAVVEKVSLVMPLQKVFLLHSAGSEYH